MKTNINKSLLFLSAFLLLGIVFVSCSKEINTETKVKGELVSLAVKIKQDVSGDFAANKQAALHNATLPGDPGYVTVTDTSINDIIAFVFDAVDSSLVTRQTFNSTQISSGLFNISTTSGFRRIYLVANVDTKGDEFSNVNQERDLLYRIKTVRNSDEVEKPLISTGFVACEIVAGSSPYIEISLVRMVSRIDIQYIIDDAMPGLQNARVDSVKVLNVSATGYYFSQGKYNPGGKYITYRYVPGVSEKQSGRCVFYILENGIQTPTVVTVYASDGIGLSRSYTLLVDKNDLSRNKWYKLNAKITGI